MEIGEEEEAVEVPVPLHPDAVPPEPTPAEPEPEKVPA